VLTWNTKPALIYLAPNRTTLFGVDKLFCRKIALVVFQINEVDINHQRDPIPLARGSSYTQCKPSGPRAIEIFDCHGFNLPGASPNGQGSRPDSCHVLERSLTVAKYSVDGK